MLILKEWNPEVKGEFTPIIPTVDIYHAKNIEIVDTYNNYIKRIKNTDKLKQLFAKAKTKDITLRCNNSVESDTLEYLAKSEVVVMNNNKNVLGQQILNYLYTHEDTTELKNKMYKTLGSKPMQSNLITNDLIKMVKTDYIRKIKFIRERILNANDKSFYGKHARIEKKIPLKSAKDYKLRISRRGLELYNQRNEMIAEIDLIKADVYPYNYAYFKNDKALEYVYNLAKYHTLEKITKKK